MANPNSLKPFKKGVDERRNVTGLNKQPNIIRDLKELINETLTDESIKQVISSLEQQAKKGNTKAIELLLDRVYGKLIQKTDTKLDMNANINLADQDISFE